MLCFNKKCPEYDEREKNHCRYFGYVEQCDDVKITGVDDYSGTSGIKKEVTGEKYSKGKNRWGLLPWQQVKQVVEVLTFGSIKYSDDNWKRVPNSRNEYFEAAQRHLTAWFMGETLDIESGKSHLAHCVCCLLFLMFFDDNGHNK